MSINYTYESTTMYFYKLQVYSTIDVTKVEHSCVIDDLFARCSLSLYSSRCLFYTYEGITMFFYELQVICTIDVTKVEDSCERNEVLKIVHFHSTVIDVYYLHL